MDQNPHLELVVIIPEGLNSRAEADFYKEVKLLRGYFEEVKKINVCPDLVVKGAHSQVLSFNTEVPVIFASKRIR